MEYSIACSAPVLAETALSTATLEGVLMNQTERYLLAFDLDINLADLKKAS